VAGPVVTAMVAASLQELTVLAEAPVTAGQVAAAA